LCLCTVLPCTHLRWYLTHQTVEVARYLSPECLLGTSTHDDASDIYGEPGMPFLFQLSFSSTHIYIYTHRHTHTHTHTQSHTHNHTHTHHTTHHAILTYTLSLAFLLTNECIPPPSPSCSHQSLDRPESDLPRAHLWPDPIPGCQVSSRCGADRGV
jgi:ABC-type Zn2+ transport system substrate-binding protein/surface adhesin